MDIENPERGRELLIVICVQTYSSHLDIENPERGRELHLIETKTIKMYEDLDIENPERGREPKP